MNKTLLRKCQCGQIPRLCFTGRKWKIVCDSEDCAKRTYGKSIQEVTDKWNGKPICPAGQ